MSGSNAEIARGMNNFVLQFENSLMIEYKYMEDIAHGIKNARPSKYFADCSMRHFTEILTAVNFVSKAVVGVAADFAGVGFLVEFIQQSLNDYVQEKDNNKIRNFASDMVKHTSRMRTLLFKQIAREVMFRYGMCIAHFLSPEVGGSSSQLDVLARTGAIRVIYYALKNNISFEDCDQLVSGLREGFKGFPQEATLSEMFRGVIKVMNPNNKKSECMTAEGLYTQSGYVTPAHGLPGSPVYGYFYFISQTHEVTSTKGSSSKSATVAYAAKAKPKRTIFNALGNSVPVIMDSADTQVPLYGYISVPDSKIATEYSFRQHRPPTDGSNCHVPLSKTFRNRYVSYEYICDYLFAMKQIKPPATRMSFNTWLSTTAPYSFDFPTDSQTGVLAMFRGHVRGELLAQEGLKFSDGIFLENNFCYCHFSDVTFGSMQSCLMVGCIFTRCTATGAAFNFADLSLSTIERCNFIGLKGKLTLRFARLVNSNFTDFDAKPCDTEDYDVDYPTQDTFVASSAATNNETVKEMREKQIEDKHRRDLEETERQNYTTMQKQHEIWEEIMANNARLNEESEKRNEEARAKWEAKMEEEFNSKKRERMNAVNPDTLDESISQIREPVVKVTGEDSILATLMDLIFFQKPMKMLKLLKNNANVIKLHTLPQRFDYSTSGTDGQDGTKGDDGLRGAVGGGIGTDGNAGGNAQNGTSAVENTVCLMSVPGQQIFIVSPKAPGHDAVILPMLHGNVRINLSAVGGKGGNGGAGGNGGDGTNGQNGIDASSGAAGTSGTNGGNGGRGGNGGMGGNAGHSADINVMCKPNDTDLLMLIGDAKCGAVSGGKEGPRGQGGRGGNGGNGGRGSSYYNGDRYVSIPGGLGGAAGTYGNNGNDGQKGLDGKAGSLTYSIVDVTTGDHLTYKTRYDMQLSSIAPFYSTTGIIEPGQQVEVNKVTLYNAGEMPSPAHMVISIKGTTIILTNDDICKWTANVCQGKKTVELPEPRYFKVAENLLPASLSHVPYIQSELSLQAKLPRINYEFVFNTKPCPFLIMHPVDLSVAGGMTCCVYDTHVPVVITVRNKTRVGMGKMAAYPRILRVTLELPQECGSDHRFRCANTAGGSSFTTFSTDSRVCFDIDYLPAHSEMVISGSIAINPKQVSLYRSIKLQFSLCLGHIDHPSKLSHMEVIQQRMHAIQVAEYCQFLSDRDCVLVISSATTAAEVAYWRELFARLGMGTCVWNVSLYLGVTYTHPMYNFIDTASPDRIVVILNAPFKRDDEGRFFGQMFYPIDYLEQWEIFEAARRHGLRTLIVNYAQPNQPSNSIHFHNFASYLKPTATHQTTKNTPAFDGRAVVYKYIQDAGAVRDECLPEDYENCKIKLFRALSRPTEEDFNYRMEVLGSKITALRPDQQYYVFKAYQPPEKSNVIRRVLFWARYDIGNVELRRGLDTTYATVASKCVHPNQDKTVSMTTDLYTLIKLLPLKSKLTMFTTVNPEETLIHEQLFHAIASDIADEQKVFIAYVRRNGTMGTNKKRMLTWLTALSTFGSHDYSELCRSSLGKNALKNLICKLVYMGKHYGSVILAKKGNFMCNAVRETCQVIATEYLQIAPGPEFRDMMREYTTKNPVNSCDEEAVISHIRDPYNVKRCDVLFNHWMSEKRNVLTTQLLSKGPQKIRLQLPDMLDPKVFRDSVALYAKAPVYNMPLPTLFGVHPDVKILKEDSKKSGSYFVQGILPSLVTEEEDDDDSTIVDQRKSMTERQMEAIKRREAEEADRQMLQMMLAMNMENEKQEAELRVKALARQQSEKVMNVTKTETVSVDTVSTAPTTPIVTTTAAIVVEESATITVVETTQVVESTEVAKEAVNA